MANAALLALAPLAGAANRTWDGDTDPANGGTWATAANWNDDTVPGTAVGDTATLGDVTAGERIVTISAGSPQPAVANGLSRLIMTQSTTGAVNKLLLADALTISVASGTATPFAITPVDNGANVGSTVIDLNGQTLMTSGGSVTATLNGTTLLPSGSTLVLQYKDNGGAANLTNNGSITQDSASVQFDWAAGGVAGNLNRRFVNTGTWTLDNASKVEPISSTGRPTSGFAILRGNENSGTMTIQGGSSVSSESFINNAGATLNISGGGTLGGMDPDGVDVFRNAGTVTLTGTASIKTDNASHFRTGTFVNGQGTSSTVTGAAFNVGDGTTATTATLKYRAIQFTNNAGNELNIKANATLLLTSNLTSGTTSASTNLTNNGTVLQAGTLELRPNWSGTSNVLNGAIYRISGAVAKLALAPSGTGPNLDPTFTISSTGRLSGATANDQLDFDSTNSSRRLTVTSAGGKVSPGLGSGGAGTSSVGTLTLSDMSLAFNSSSGGTLEIDIGGTPASGLFDHLVLSGSLSNSGRLSLSSASNDVLEINTVDGFYPALENPTYHIVTTNALPTGTFDVTKLNGVVTTDYTVSYSATGIDITFTQVPEPASLGIFCLGAAVLTRRRRIAQ